ncbi:MAG: methylated-DNA--[protein]-cysteine S-methyltransferase [Bacteroidaceae bacterium]
MGELICGVIDNKLSYLYFVDGEKATGKLIQTAKLLRAEIIFCQSGQNPDEFQVEKYRELFKDIDKYNESTNSISVNSVDFFDNPYARNRKPIDKNQPLFAMVQEELDQYFAKKRVSFDIPLYFVGSPFQKQVWESLVNIPYGESRSYHQQAESMGRLTAIRAVANSNGQNRILILVPCHRVISSDGSINGYSAGIWRKKELLELEGIFKTTQKLPGFF